MSQEVIEKVKEAAQNHKLLRIIYVDSKGKVSERNTEPYKIEYRDSGIVLWAHCLEKDSVRSFKISGIQKAEVSDTDFTPRHDFDF